MIPAPQLSATCHLLVSPLRLVLAPPMDSPALSNRRNLVRDYSFHGSVGIVNTGTTQIPFVSVPSPFAINNLVPTILRQFGAEGATYAY